MHQMVNWQGKIFRDVMMGGGNWCKITHPFESEWFYAPSTMGVRAAACVNIMTGSQYGCIDVALKSVAMAD